MSESEDLPARTSANALHQILKSVKSDKNGPLYVAWAAILQAEWKTPEFDQRHAEVMNLWMDVVNEIANLEPENIRKRMEKYTHSWWLAIVQPVERWNAIQPSDIAPTSDLDMLETMSDLIEAQLGNLTQLQVGSDLGRLYAECDGWLSVISNTDELTNESLREELLAQVKHLIWLIDNAGTFGLTRIIHQGDQVTGALIRASARKSAVKNPHAFQNRISQFITALTLVANLIHSSQVVYDSADHALPKVEKVVKEITSGTGNVGNARSSRDSH